MKRIYMIDDEATKHSYLNKIVDELNESLMPNQSPFVDGFNGEGLATLTSPKLMIKAAQDSEGICLIDLEIKSYSGDIDLVGAGIKMVELLRTEAGWNVEQLAEIDKIKAVLSEQSGAPDHYLISSVMLAICKQFGTRCLIISNRAGGIVLEKLKIQYGFSSQLFPYGGDTSHLLEQVVQAIKTEWFKEEYLSFDEFVISLEEMNHVEVDRQGKANDPLRRYLGLDEKQFLDDFGCAESPDVSAGNALRSEVIAALKGISGLTGQDGTSYDGRPIGLDGAWLIALGVYRRLFPNKEWHQVFKTSDLGALKGGEFPHLHPLQKDRIIRRETLKAFERMCELLFIDRAEAQSGSNEISSLEKVTLTKSSLTFTLKFDAQVLQRRISFEARKTRGEKNLDTGHDASESVWQFWASASFSDSPNAAAGVFGVQPRMNVFQRGAKTEVTFGD